jgi:SRSO17 transposase
MNLKDVTATQQALFTFVNQFKAYLGRTERLHWCWMYLSGLLLDGERKSIQPMAERLPGGNEQAMQQFVNQSPWAHETMQIELGCFLAQQLGIQRGVLALDDTTLLKKGRHSIGIGYQYCGALGKLANCQSIVTWHYVAQQGEHFPLVGELFLPQSWTQDVDRLKRYGVPNRRFRFKKKWALAYELLKQIPADKLPYEALVFDAGYGEVREFLRKLDEEGHTFVAYIPESHSFWPLDVAVNTKQAKTGRSRRYEDVADKTAKPLSAHQWRIALINQGIAWQTLPLPLASKPTTQVIAVRVREVITQAFYRPGKAR